MAGEWVMSEVDLNQILKVLTDRLRAKLGLPFRSTDYAIVLDDHLKNDALLMKSSEVVTIRINTLLFTNAVIKKGNTYEFKRLLERCLEAVPKMMWTLSHKPIADALSYDSETKKFTKLQEEELDSKFHSLLKQIHFASEVRATAIHWKSGTVVREFGKTKEIALRKAESKIISILQDPEMFNRDNDELLYIEPHEDYISDVVADCKVLNKEEVRTVITKLEEEYLK